MGNISSAVIVAVAIFVLLVMISIIIGRNNKVSRLTETFDDFDDAPVSLDIKQLSPIAASLSGMLSSMGIDIDAEVKKSRLLMSRAGILSPDAPYYFLIMNRFLGYIIAIIGLLIFVFNSNSEGNTFWLYAFSSGLIMVLGLFGARLYVANQTTKYREIMTDAFPDTMDLLLVCVESGLTIDAALARVCSELGRVYPHMTREFNNLRLELALTDRIQALQNMSERTDLPSIRALISSLIQTERFGTSLSESLSVLANEFRVTRLMEAEERAAKLSVKITLPLIMFLLPALVLMMLGPAIVQIAANGGIFGNRASVSEEE